MCEESTHGIAEHNEHSSFEEHAQESGSSSSSGGGAEAAMARRGICGTAAVVLSAAIWREHTRWRGEVYDHR